MPETQTVSIDTSKEAVNPTLEQEAAALEAAAKAGTPAAPAGDRPEWLSTKFASVEDQAKAYVELEKKFGQRTPPEAPPEAPAETPPPDADAEADPAKANEDAAKAATKAAGVDYDAISAKYWQNGKLEDADYQTLEKAGIPKALVDSYIAGQEAIVTSTRNAVYASVGGEDNYASMVEWAADNYSPDEIEAFNTAVNGTNMNATTLAVKGLKARYEAEVGVEPTTLLTGHANAKTGSAVYRSISELQKDMADDRYWNDPAFRKDVEQKLARSDIM